MKYILFLAFFFSGIYNHTLAVASEEKHALTMHIGVTPDEKASEGYKNSLISAYKEIGYQVVFHEMVAYRAVKMMEADELDALFMMIDTYAANFPILTPVPVTLGEGELLLICQKELVCDDSVLQKGNNLVGVTKTSFAANYLKNNTEASIYEITTRTALGEMLTKKRLDYILMLNSKQYGNLAQIDENNFSTFTLKTVRAFHYIHKKHQQMLPQLTQAIKNVTEKYATD